MHNGIVLCTIGGVAIVRETRFIYTCVYITKRFIFNCLKKVKYRLDAKCFDFLRYYHCWTTKKNLNLTT